MEIIVTEMPKFPCQCPLSKQKHGEWICSKYDCECNIDMCDLLKPIDSFYQNRIEKFFEPLAKLMDE